MDMSRLPITTALSGRAAVFECVGHLIRRRQHEVDRIVRILQHAFVSERPKSPKRGMILAIVLVGDYANRNRPDTEDGHVSAYEIWAIVDHPEYRGLEKSWGPARGLLKQELGGRATVELSVFDDADIARAIVENGMIREKVGSAIVLYDGRAPVAAPQSRLPSSSPYISS